MTALQVLQAKKARLTTATPQPTTLGDPTRPSLFNMYSIRDKTSEKDPTTISQPQRSAFGFSDDSRVDMSRTAQVGVMNRRHGNPVEIDGGKFSHFGPGETIRPTLDHDDEELYPDPASFISHSKISINFSDEKRSTPKDPKDLRFKAGVLYNTTDTSSPLGSQSNNGDSAEDENKAPLCATASNLVGRDSHDMGDLLLSQDTRGSLSVYNRVLSTINAADAPSPWSMVGKGRKRAAPIHDNNQQAAARPAQQDECYRAEGKGYPRECDTDRGSQDSKGDPSSKLNHIEVGLSGAAPPTTAAPLTRGAKRNASQILALIKGNNSTTTGSTGQGYHNPRGGFPSATHTQKLPSPGGECNVIMKSTNPSSDCLSNTKTNLSENTDGAHEESRVDWNKVSNQKDITEVDNNEESGHTGVHCEMDAVVLGDRGLLGEPAIQTTLLKPQNTNLMSCDPTDPTPNNRPRKESNIEWNKVTEQKDITGVDNNEESGHTGVDCEMDPVAVGDYRLTGEPAIQTPLLKPQNTTLMLCDPTDPTPNNRPGQHQSPLPALRDEDIRADNRTRASWSMPLVSSNPGGGAPSPLLPPPPPPPPPHSHKGQMGSTLGGDVSVSAAADDDDDPSQSAGVATTAPVDLAACFDLSFSPLSHASFSDDESYTGVGTPQLRDPQEEEREQEGVSLSTAVGAYESSSSSCHGAEEQLEGPVGQGTSVRKAVSVGLQDSPSNREFQDGPNSTDSQASASSPSKPSTLTQEGVASNGLENECRIDAHYDETGVNGERNNQQHLLEVNGRDMGRGEVTLGSDHRSPLNTNPSTLTGDHEKNMNGTGTGNVLLSEGPLYMTGRVCSQMVGTSTGCETVTEVPDNVFNESGRLGPPSPVGVDVTHNRRAEIVTDVVRDGRRGQVWAVCEEDGPEGGRKSANLRVSPSPPRPKRGEGDRQTGLLEMPGRGVDSRHGPGSDRLPRGGAGSHRPHQTANPTAQPAIHGDGDGLTHPAFINGDQVNGGWCAPTGSDSSAFVSPSCMAATDSGTDSGPAHRGNARDKSAANKTQITEPQSQGEPNRANNETGESRESLDNMEDLHLGRPEMETNLNDVEMNEIREYERQSEIVDDVDAQSDSITHDNTGLADCCVPNENTSQKTYIDSTINLTKSSQSLSGGNTETSNLAVFSPTLTHGPNQRLSQCRGPQDIPTSTHPTPPPGLGAFRLENLEFSPEIPFTYDNLGSQPTDGNDRLGKGLLLGRGWAATGVATGGAGSRIEPGGNKGTRQQTPPGPSLATRPPTGKPPREEGARGSTDSQVDQKGESGVDTAQAQAERTCQSQWSEFSDMSMDLTADFDMELYNAMEKSKTPKTFNEANTEFKNKLDENKQINPLNKVQENQDEVLTKHMPCKDRTYSQSDAPTPQMHSFFDEGYSDVSVQGMDDLDSIHSKENWPYRPKQILPIKDEPVPSPPKTRVSLKERLTLGIYKRDDDRGDTMGGGDDEQPEDVRREEPTSKRIGRIATKKEDQISHSLIPPQGGDSTLAARRFPHPMLSRYSSRPEGGDPDVDTLTTGGRPSASNKSHGKKPDSPCFL